MGGREGRPVLMDQWRERKASRYSEHMLYLCKGTLHSAFNACPLIHTEHTHIFFFLFLSSTCSEWHIIQPSWCLSAPPYATAASQKVTETDLVSMSHPGGRDSRVSGKAWVLHYVSTHQQNAKRGALTTRTSFCTSSTWSGITQLPKWMLMYTARTVCVPLQTCVQMVNAQVRLSLQEMKSWCFQAFNTNFLHLHRWIKPTSATEL